MYTITCQYCGKVFESKSKQSKFCTLSCKRKLYKAKAEAEKRKYNDKTMFDVEQDVQEHTDELSRIERQLKAIREQIENNKDMLKVPSNRPIYERIKNEILRDAQPILKEKNRLLKDYFKYTHKLTDEERLVIYQAIVLDQTVDNTKLEAALHNLVY